MKSATPKVLHRIGGRTLVGHAIAAAREAQPEHLAVVVRHERDLVADARRRGRPRGRHRRPGRGQGHRPGRRVRARRPARRPRRHRPGHVRRRAAACRARRCTALVDAPRRQRQRRHRDHRQPGRPDRLRPHPARRRRLGRGRSSSRRTPPPEQLRDHARSTPASTPSTRRSCATPSAEVGTDNAQGEKYLTDVLAIARGRRARRARRTSSTTCGRPRASTTASSSRGSGRSSTAASPSRWMRDGVTIVDPATTWIDADVTIGRDATILPGTQLLGATTIGADAVIGPDTTLDGHRGRRRRERRRAPQAALAVIGPGATVGPFSYLRPGTELGAKGKIGGFVETKNAKIGDGRQGAAPDLLRGRHHRRGRQHRRRHDLRQLRRRGQAPHRPSGRTASSARDSVLVAPVNIADGAYVGAGSAVIGGRRARPDRRGARPAAQHRRLGRAPSRRHQDRGGRGGGRTAYP